MNVLITIEAAVMRNLARDYSARSVKQAAQRAYVAFARQYPTWAENLHDEQFLMRGAQPLLEQYARGNIGLEPAALAHAWADTMWYRNDAVRERIVRTLMPAADAFVQLYKAELATLRADAIALHEPVRARTAG